ncbi:MAG: hypothetical protein ABFS02_09575 [Pseudomonadota bacterium]
MPNLSPFASKAVWMNFIASVWLSILSAALLLYDSSLILPEPLEAYGPLNSNLKYVIVYIGAAQLLLWFLFYRKKSHREALFAGIFLVLIAFELPFYGSVNDFPVPLYVTVAAAYMGVSHLIYGVQGIETRPPEESKRR